MNRRLLAAAIAILSIGSYMAIAQTPAPNMSFFVTSSNPKGGNLGGLTGADAVCQIAGPGGRRGRQDLARILEHEHRRRENPDRQRPVVQLQRRADRCERCGPAQREQQDLCGDIADGEGHDAELPLGQSACAPAVQQLQHDMMTGTKEDGTKDADTCKDWTVGNGDAKTMLGHADRLGRNPGVNSWNAIHASQGCGMEQLAPTGGAGLIYCFATN